MKKRVLRPALTLAVLCICMISCNSVTDNGVASNDTIAETAFDETTVSLQNDIKTSSDLSIDTVDSDNQNTNDSGNYEETFSGTVYIAEELPLNDAAENTATPGESITLFGKAYELRATQSSASNYDKNRWPRSAYKLLDQSTHNEKGRIEIGYDGQILSVSFTTSPVKIDRRVESTEGMIEQFKNALAELIDFSKLEGATVTDSNENGVRTIQWRKMKDGIELPGKVRASIGTDGSLTVVKTPDYDLPDLDILLDVEADNALTRAISEKLTAYYGSNGVELIAVKGFRIPTQRDSYGCYTLYMGKPALFLMVVFSCETDRYTETEYLENVFVIFDV